VDTPSRTGLLENQCKDESIDENFFEKYELYNLLVNITMTKDLNKFSQKCLLKMNNLAFASLELQFKVTFASVGYSF
jgi:hypothetical protein